MIFYYIIDILVFLYKENETKHGKHFFVYLVPILLLSVIGRDLLYKSTRYSWSNGINFVIKENVTSLLVKKK